MSQADYFLKIDGIPGESTDDKHKNEIDVGGWDWGCSNTGSTHQGGGGGSAKAHFNDFSFQMRVSKATPKLMLAIATGKHIPNAFFVARKAGGQKEEYLKIKFKDLIISSYRTGGAGGDVMGSDSCTFNFAQIWYDYCPQNAQGGLEAAVAFNYNIKENTGA